MLVVSSKKSLICGFYREWTREGKNSVGDQVTRIEELAGQIEAASNKTKRKVDEIAAVINLYVLMSMDECAPITTIKIRNQHVFGISENTKNLIQERDQARQKISHLTHAEKTVQNEKSFNYIINHNRIYGIPHATHAIEA